MERKIYVIDGNRFDNLDGFFAEVSSVLIPDVDWGRNLDAFYDILGGGFGTPDDGFILIWKNSDRSRRMLGYDLTIATLENQCRGIAHLTNAELRQRDYILLKKLYPDANENWLQESLETFEIGNLGLVARLRRAKQHQGDTIFDWIIYAIKPYLEIELRLE